jgi:hypothetical protein
MWMTTGATLAVGAAFVSIVAMVQTPMKCGREKKAIHVRIVMIVQTRLDKSGLRISLPYFADFQGDVRDLVQANIGIGVKKTI